jgi:hypothetical protein
MKQAAVELAAKGVFIGTSSWKYELCHVVDYAELKE